MEILSFIPAHSDVEVTFIICATILLCLLTVVIAIGTVLRIISESRLEMLKEEHEAERQRRKDEEAIRKEKQQHEDLWRMIEHEWKEEA